jgi:hypothetical protein
MVKSAMEIKYLGGQTVVIKGKKESVLINPEDEQIEKNGGRIVLFNQSKYEQLRTVGERVSIMGPGEYEVGGVEVNGFNGGGGNTIFTVLIDGVMVGIMGKQKEELSDKKADKITGVDVLIVDIKNEDGISNKSVLKIAKKWGANYVVPAGATGDDPDLKKFLDETDSEGLEPIDGLKIDKDNLPDGMEVVCLM